MRFRGPRILTATLAGALVGLTLAVAGAPARAQEVGQVKIGLGYLSLRKSQDAAAEFRLEFRPDHKLWFLYPFFGVMATADRSVYGYGGLSADINLGRRIVITPSLAAGYYERGKGIDLGHEIEFRSAIELAYRFDNGMRLGATLYHLSNASLGARNPGTEVLSLSFSIPLFGTR
jgi:lipid A 3-O-deacylase